MKFPDEGVSQRRLNSIRVKISRVIHIFCQTFLRERLIKFAQLQWAIVRKEKIVREPVGYGIAVQSERSRESIETPAFFFFFFLYDFLLHVRVTFDEPLKWGLPSSFAKSETPPLTNRACPRVSRKAERHPSTVSISHFVEAFGLLK